MAQIISLKRYLDSERAQSAVQGEPGAITLLPATVDAYRSALVEMGLCGQDACPALGEALKLELAKLEAGLSASLCGETVERTKRGVRDELRSWGQRAASHSREKTAEVKEILLLIARAAESAGERDQRCADQITEVTAQLKGIANLEDLTIIRAAIEKSATDLKTSIDRMAVEAKEAVEALKKEVSTYQARLEEAEQAASRDALTGLANRPWVEAQMERWLENGSPFCVAILDIDGFKQVNDEYGHLAGDELLKQFAGELKAASRSADIIGRWGGDEFILLLPGAMAVAEAQTARLRDWVCGNYRLESGGGSRKLRVMASVGLSERQPVETIGALVERADAAMYRNKAASRANGNQPRR